LPASKRDRAFLLGESESEAMSGGLLDVLVCLDGVPEEGRGGTGFDCDVLLTVATEGVRRRSRSGMGGGGAALVGLGLAPAVRGRGAWAWESSNTEVTGEDKGDMVWPRRSCTTMDGIPRSSPLPLTLEAVCSERSESDRGGYAMPARGAVKERMDVVRGEEGGASYCWAASLLTILMPSSPWARISMCLGRGRAVFALSPAPSPNVAMLRSAMSSP
jgi:hypothetical protein